MVDFNKQIKNSNKFREACLRYQKTGSYCMYPSGTTEFYAFWDEEKRRCIEGYTAQDGEWISGYNYFYLKKLIENFIINNLYFLYNFLF